MTSKLISLLLPVGSQYDLLAETLQALEPMAFFLRDEMEVVVADCGGTPGVKALIGRFRDEGMPIVHRPVEPGVLLEEMVLQSLDACSGTYTAFLRTKDRLNVGGFMQVLRDLQRDPVDLIIVNPAIQNAEGNVNQERSRFLRSIPPMPNVTAEFLVREIGFTGLLFGITGIIARTAPLLAVPLGEYVEASPIYVLAAAFIHAFGSRPARLIANDVFELRPDRSDFGAEFEIPAFLKRQNLPSLYPWSLGIIRLMSRLQHNGKVSKDFFLRLQEVNPTGSYRQSSHCFHKVLECIEFSLASGDTPFPLSSEDELLLQDVFAECQMTLATKLVALAPKLRSLHTYFQGSGMSRSKEQEDILVDAFRHLNAEERTEMSAVLRDWAVGELQELRRTLVL